MKTHKRPRDTSDKRSIAQSFGLSWYYTGLPCSYGHIAKRDVNNAQCLECRKNRESRVLSEEKNRYDNICGLPAHVYREHLATVRKERNPVNRDVAYSAGLSFYFCEKPCKKGHIDARRVRTNECATCNYNTLQKAREKFNATSKRPVDKEKRRKNFKIWCQRNSGKMNAHSASRKASKLKATPSWLTSEHLQEIEKVYKTSIHLKKETGVNYSVDHIVPLQGETVCGLHVPWNLRVISAAENSAKKNRWDPIKDSDGLR